MRAPGPPFIHSLSLSPEFWHCPHADFTKITCGVSFSLLPSKNILNITGVIIFLECLKESICECLDTVLSFDSIFRESIPFKFSNEVDPCVLRAVGPLAAGLSLIPPVQAALLARCFQGHLLNCALGLRALDA